MGDVQAWVLNQYEKAMTAGPVNVTDEHCQEFECPEIRKADKHYDLSTYTTYPACMGPDYLFAIGVTEIQYIYSMGKKKQINGSTDNILSLFVKYHGYPGIYKMMLPTLMEWTDKDILKMIAPAMQIFFSQLKQRGNEHIAKLWIQGGCQGQLKGKGDSKIMGVKQTLETVYFKNADQMIFGNSDIVDCIEKNRDIIKMRGISLPNMVIGSDNSGFRFLFKPVNKVAELANIFKASFATDKYTIETITQELQAAPLTRSPGTKTKLDAMKTEFAADGKKIRDHMSALPPM